MNNTGCPFLMSDGRAFTDYRSSAYLNDELRMQGNVGNSYEFRQYLINNGLSALEQIDGRKEGCMNVRRC